MAKKIKKEELEELKTLINNFNKLQLELGRLDIEKHQISHKVSESQMGLQKFQDQLKDAYGDVSVDINTGEIKENVNKED